MEAGVCGVHGQAVQRHVEQGQEAEPEHATTLLRLTEEQIVRGMQNRNNSVTLIHVPVLTT